MVIHCLQTGYSEHIGNDWITNLAHIEKLAIPMQLTKKAQQEFMNIKYQNKLRLAKYIKEHNGIEVDPRSIFRCAGKTSA